MSLLNKIRSKPPRIKLAEDIMAHFFEEIYRGSVSELSRRTRLPYGLIYNIVHKRVKSVSAREYKLIFGKTPPVQASEKVDGAFFRNMVELWLFLNNHVTKSDLYREVSGKVHAKRVDYRIFSGKIKMIDSEMEKMMEERFLSHGLDRRTIENWIMEIGAPKTEARIPYDQIEPLLRFLENVAGIHPSSILNQHVDRYKNGALKSVSRKVYDRATALKEKAEHNLTDASKLEMEKIKEEVYGKKKGYTLYAEIEEELKFLQKFARKSPKRYLGRSTTVYEREGCRRIASSKARKIRSDCDMFIRNTPHLPIRSLPKVHRLKWYGLAVMAIKEHLTRLLFQEEGIDFEKRILTPSHSKSEYRKPEYGFTQFDLAPKILGIKKNVFDLIVATNCEIFKMVGQYEKRWYLSDLYLKELSEKKYFDLIAAKYELLARKHNHSSTEPVCMQ